MKKMNQAFCLGGYTSLCFLYLRTSTTPRSRASREKEGTVYTGNMCLHHVLGAHTSPSPCTAVLDKEKKTSASIVCYNFRSTF